MSRIILRANRRLLVRDLDGLSFEVDKRGLFTVPFNYSSMFSIDCDCKSYCSCAYKDSVDIDLPKRPTPNRFSDISEFKITENSNVKYARIFRHTDKIEVNPKVFDNIYWIQKAYILMHEVAHNRHSSEYDCDQLAEYMLIAMGFDPRIVILGASIIPDKKRRMRNYSRLKQYIDYVKRF